jgi:FkbM family methyltransferase
MSALASALVRLRHGAQLLRDHPSLFIRRVFAELNAPMYRRRAPVRKTIRGVVCEFDFRFDEAIKLMYHEVYEPDMVNAMKAILKPGDTFIDVGANIGYISAVGLGLVGPSGSVHSFEPVPEFYARLQRLGDLNPGRAFTANQCALGERDGEASISVSNVANIGWNTMVPGLMSRETTRESITVPVTTLGAYIRERNLRNITLIKIDTEGFEFPVLKGLLESFHPQSVPPCLLVEVAPSAYALLGTSLDELGTYMKSRGYEAFAVHDRPLPVDLNALVETTNVLFVPRI